MGKERMLITGGHALEGEVRVRIQDITTGKILAEQRISVADLKAAMDADLALYAAHLPLDANRAYGNNFELARFLGLKDLKRAFVYHGETIGVVGTLPNGKKVGVCSGGAGCHAVDAKELGCDLFVTGEASWGEVIAAENVGMPMVCAGHYQTETFGVKALAKAMARRLKVATEFIPREGEGRTDA